jgi:aminomethyltransferase
LEAVDLVVCRTGYTGEVGFELVVPWGDAGTVWDALIATGVQPCGLGARDTLRTEMGYPLHGQDLTLDISPVQARSGWAVGWSKPAFWGREALAKEKAEGPRRSLRGLELTGRGIPRGHMRVYAGSTPVGETTSGTFSPTKKSGIALALLDTGAGLSDGDLVEIDIRGRRAEARIVKPPFVQTSVR